MKFIIILNNKTNPDLLDKIKERLNYSSNKINYDIFILNNSIPIDSDAKIMIQILLNESYRAPVIMDYETAKHYPEIIKKQHTIIAIDNHSKLDNDILESLISSGAGIDIFEKNYKLIEENKLLIIEENKFNINSDYYIHLYKIYKNEHLKYPTVLLSRGRITVCNGNWDELLFFFENRLNEMQFIGWNYSKNNNKSYIKYIDKFDVFNNTTAISNFGDTRLSVNENVVLYKNIKTI